MKTTPTRWTKTIRSRLEGLVPVLNKWLQQVTMQRNPFAQSVKELEQARLMGMYLAQTNNKRSYAAQRISSQERRCGRYPHVRERASHFPS